MKKTILITLVSIFALSLIPVIGEAQFRIENPLTATTVGDLINGVIDFIFYVAIIVAPLLTIVAGFYFITAAGDPNKVKTAKSIITYTLIGLAIIFLAKGLYAMIEQVLGIRGG